MIAALLAVAAGSLAYAADLWPQIENDTLDMRFSLRKASRSSEVVVVAIDDKTFSELRKQWPFPRSLHADLLRRLHAAGASTIVYDVQFTEPTSEREDLALYDEIARVGKVVLATTEVDSAGHTNVLGGDDSLRQIHAVAAASNLPADPGGIIRRYRYSALGLQSLAVASARVDGHPVAPSRFARDGALIDFRGPPGTLQTVSFADVLRGKVDPRAFAGKIVVVGVSAPTLQDVHQTSTATTSPMAGPEIQANAIWSALHGNPLQPAAEWLTLLAILLGGIIAPLASLRVGVRVSALIAVATAALYLVLAQLAFEQGVVLTVSYPLIAWLLGMIGMLVANYIGALVERNAFSRQLGESQLELVQRLAHAVEFRDNETGEHIQRIGILSERLALATGWSPAEAEMLRHASAMHDIGKISIPDRVLLKPGTLDAEERAIINTHPATGAEILAGSANPLVRMAQTIALTHHERWDGHGYPAGLKGEEIPLAGRICAICDVYDALLARRPYKDAWQLGDVLAELQRGAGSQFDPQLVAAFLALAPELTNQLDVAQPTVSQASTAPAASTGA